MKKTALTLSALACVLAVTAQAQEAPAPRRMPRTSVSSEVLVQARDPMPASRQVQGPAAIIDGEKLRIGETDLRLFGIVPPQLSASFGPQARSALDALANGQSVSCQIRDRDRDGRLLATCHNAGGSDMALELLKRGLAVTARGSIAGTELATGYLAAEQAAQTQKIGLWSGAIPTAATPVTVAVKQDSAPTAEAEAKKDDKVSPRSDKSSASETQTSEAQAKIAAEIMSQHAQTQARLDEVAWAQDESAGFFERYQILIAGLLMLATAVGITGALWIQKRNDRLEEIKAVAAALRGELMAARAICLGRMKEITNEEEDRAATWPRIRATLYQAYVGRLGLLGADLARQVSSIYGQSSDYAALYNATNGPINVPKRHALETLARRIEAILPKLASIESTGALSFSSVRYTALAQQIMPRPEQPAAASVSPAATPSSAQTENAETPAAETAVASSPSPYRDVVETDQHLPPAPALWEAVRQFIQKPKQVSVPQDMPGDEPLSSDYAEMIEADMARYQYTETLENLDLVAKKKRG